LKKCSNRLIGIPYMLACHLQIDVDPDPVYHFNADPDPAHHFDADTDPDPTFQFDADPDPQYCNYA
jgi:hypothetical protein